MADNTKERTQAEAQFKKTQKQQEGAAAMAAYVAEATRFVQRPREGILASSVPKLSQLRPVIVRRSTLFRARLGA